jgi:hypothetical protein
MLAAAACGGNATVENEQARRDAGACSEACLSGGRCSSQGRCVYPAPKIECFSELRYESGQCVLAEPPGGCGCADDGNACTREICAAGDCVHAPEYDQNGCGGGVCHAGRCCQGCVQEGECRTGKTLDACGSYGRKCEPCPPTGAPDPCLAYACNGGCTTEPVKAPGCPPCGALDEPCCAGNGCDSGLTCQGVSCGEDCGRYLCRP